ncbi:DUF2911 domain-containing protein [Hymenobacter sp. PAMC 26628]|uniref:DUF2911 domain-containing protein n=1 Tax=Hymenobacter sp. PAMC 26628 TaxID=1484118 RepID=UPI00076FF9ED|nr:DUF2911 domain-containing protein [Hymenobacter sp. PAMC 26628]AMJ65262.1 hypothetical protein AXW84_07355 [Hymenobacter sp. PAMC 26628]
MKPAYFCAALAGLLAPAAHAQTTLTIPQASPAVRVRQAFSTSFVELHYARPSLRGRVAFGGLVPYGQVWRAGANAVTTIHFGEEVKVAGQAVPAGTYALLAIPGKTDWMIILNRDTAQWGAYDYKQSLDVLRVSAKAAQLAAPQETLSLSLENLRPAAADLVLAWDRAVVRVPLTANPDPIVLAQIREAMKGTKKPYVAAAQYYYDSNQPDLTPALGWFDEFIKTNPDDAFYGYYWRAKLLLKQGKKQEAIAAANKSLELVKTDKNEISRAEYTRLNQGVLAEASGKK